ncbi:MAG: hypothetical protein ABSF84_13680 [Acidimicrobiales bacterium]|jgi:hypothetical protein
MTTTAHDTTEGSETAMPVRLADTKKRKPRGLRIWLVLLLAIASVSVIGATAPLSSRTSSAGASTTCASDGNGGCKIVLPCPVGQSTNCPTVDVQPNTNVVDDQYVYVTATNFDPSDFIRVALCSANGSATDPQCLNGVWETQQLTPVSVGVTSDPSTSNETSLSYPVFLDPSGEGNALIPSHDIINKTGTGPGFYCDSTTDPCDVIVTAETASDGSNGPLVSTQNSAVVPLTYATQSAGCPSSDPQVQIETSYSLEHFIPAAVEATCGGSHGVVALNTANDDATVVKDFAAGNDTLSFVDNVSDETQLAALLGKSYAYIPVALSGTAESFLAEDSNNGSIFPINSYNLTPNMVAGLLTSLYQSPAGVVTLPPKPTFALADNLTAALAAATPPVTCADLVGCPSTKSKKKQVAYESRDNAFELLNPSPANGYSPQQFGSFNSNVASGSSYETTQWICDAPNTPFSVQVPLVSSSQPVSVNVTDTNLGPDTLTTPPLGSTIWPPYPGAQWIFPQCQGYSTLPALSAAATNFGAAQEPSFQAKAMRTWCFGGGVVPTPGNGAGNAQNPCAAFGLMDTSEARFLGLSTASLENAAGDFVAPDTTSLEAAASDFTPCPTSDLACPAGTYQINFGDTNAAAYPLANLTYAVVPTSQLSYSEGTAVKNLLTNMVNFSYSGSLPAGYAPLPKAIYDSALADITADVSIAPAPPATTTTTTTTTTSTTSSSTGSSGYSSDTGSSNFSSGTGSSFGSGSTESALPLTASTGNGSSNSGAKGSTPVAAPPSSIPSGVLLVGLADTTRYLLPAIIVLALGSLVGGVLLLFGPGAAARRRRSEGGPS